MVDNILKYAVLGGGFAAITGAIYFNEKIQGQFRNEEFFTKPMKLLRNYQPAVEQLGTPINTKKIDLGDTKANNIDGLNAKLMIPVKGPNDKGYLYVIASRKMAGESWQIDKLDLEIHSSKHKWTFYQNSATSNS